MMELYQKLARHLDDLPGGYPATDSGVESQILSEPRAAGILAFCRGRQPGVLQRLRGLHNPLPDGRSSVGFGEGVLEF
jgi:hypothetical protein